jgi:hypothetical protein
LSLAEAHSPAHHRHLAILRVREAFAWDGFKHSALKKLKHITWFSNHLRSRTSDCHFQIGTVNNPEIVHGFKRVMKPLCTLEKRNAEKHVNWF